VTLFWSLFGLTQLGSVREGQIQSFTKRVAEYMLMCYHAMAVIVLVNMLIAMMSNSFQEIEVTDPPAPSARPRSYPRRLSLVSVDRDAWCWYCDRASLRLQLFRCFGSAIANGHHSECFYRLLTLTLTPIPTKTFAIAGRYRQRMDDKNCPPVIYPPIINSNYTLRCAAMPPTLGIPTPW